MSIPEILPIDLDNDDLSNLKEILVAVRVTLNEVSCPLSQEKRQSLPCIDQDAIDLMTDTLSKIGPQVENPSLVLKLTTTKRRLDQVNAMMPILSIINDLKQDLSDTIQLVGSEVLKETRKMKKEEMFELGSVS